MTDKMKSAEIEGLLDALDVVIGAVTRERVRGSLHEIIAQAHMVSSTPNTALTKMLSAFKHSVTERAK